MIFPLQTDPRWSKYAITPGNTIHDIGCTTCAASALLSWYGMNLLPDELAKKLKYTKDAKILWQSFNDAKLPMVWLYRSYSFDKNILDSVIKSETKSALLEFKTVYGSHWCTALDIIGKNYYVFNPLKGRENSKSLGDPVGFSIFDKRK